MKNLYVHYGCGLSAPSEWINFDTSPTLRFQKIPVMGSLFRSKLNTVFPDNVLYGDIVKGLPVEDGSCAAVYCSHVLEHLALNDFRVALKNTNRILQKGGIFRCVVPDLEQIARNYLAKVDKGNVEASIEFIGPGTLLGVRDRPRGFRHALVNAFGNAHHLWMWDHYSLTSELEKAGFVRIRRASFNDSSEPMFKLVENSERFEGAVALECSK